jgi:hypothetical protein
LTYDLVALTDADSEQERKRLGKLYFLMADGELLKIASGRASLTELAQLILDREISPSSGASSVCSVASRNTGKHTCVSGVTRRRVLREQRLADPARESLPTAVRQTLA